MEDLQKGDVIVDKNDNERTVIERLGDIDSFMGSIGWELDENGYTFEDNYINFRTANILRQAITSLIKELVAEAKPDRKPPMKMGNPTKESSDLDKMIFAKKKGHNEAIDQYEQNLLKALESK